MHWYHYVAYFFGGAFLANTFPRLGNGHWSVLNRADARRRVTVGTVRG